ncbi:MAG: glycosyltransferase, partial [Acidobacteria bacterium]|nr:glycosyltransferase [Acidobacteriota bacterium]
MLPGSHDRRCCRVVHLIGTAQIGGVQSLVREVLRYTNREKFLPSVWILGPEGPLTAELRAKGIQVVHFVQFDSRITFAARLLSALFRNRIDVLHAHVGGRVPRYLAQLAGARAVITHVHGFPDEWTAALRAVAPELRKQVQSCYVPGTDYLIACSKSVAHLLGVYCPAILDRVHVIYAGLDPERIRLAPVSSTEAIQARKSLGIGVDVPVVGFVGRLVPQKGLPYLIEVAEIVLRRLTNTCFLIVGDGPDRPLVEAASNRLGPDRFRVLGERHDIPTCLAAFDVLVVCSEWEPFGIVALEAMAVGRAVAAFDVNGIPEVVIDGETGRLVQHRDCGALADAVTDLLQDRDRSQELGLAGRQRVE